jgi:DNA-binding NtrC family response regulator
MPPKRSPQKNVLIVDDEDSLREVYVQRLRRKGYAVKGASSAEDALKILRDEVFDVALVDIRMNGMSGLDLLKKVKARESSPEVIVITGYGSIDSAIEAMKLGAYHYLTKPCKLPALELTVQKACEKHEVERENERLREELKIKDAAPAIIFRSQAMVELMEQVERVAQANSSVVLEGESGVGKELIARAIHTYSPRRDHAFIAVNCSNLQENLLESELFGHEKGAFSGAMKQKRGLIELAERGTLFIDEVVEMKRDIQSKLLRLMENGSFRRVGGEVERFADVRFVAASNRSLADEVRRGDFREDLYFRLNVITLTVPPLRERKADIPLLVEYFLQKNRAVLKTNKQLARECLDFLMGRSWPGNVRELSNAVERAVILSKGRHILPEDFGFLGGGSQETRLLSLRKLEENHIRRVLRETNNNKTHAARILGISVRTLQRKLQEYADN